MRAIGDQIGGGVDGIGMRDIVHIVVRNVTSGGGDMVFANGGGAAADLIRVNLGLGMMTKHRELPKERNFRIDWKRVEKKTLTLIAKERREEIADREKCSTERERDGDRRVWRREIGRCGIHRR